jgi:hypothetical protein
VAQAAADRFHAHLNSDQVDSIYEEAHAKFREGGAKAYLTGFLNNVRATLGAVQSSELVKSQVGYTPQHGTQVILTYKTRFERDATVEQFLWQIEDGAAKLVHYRNHSMLLSAQTSPGK